MEQPRSLVEVMWRDNDLKLLEAAGNRASAFEMFVNILLRLPSPRAYICENFVKSILDNDWLWEEGRQVLTANLTERGMSVIDPETVRTIMVYNSHLVTRDRNPLHWALLKQGVLDAIYIPDDRRRTIQRDRTCNAAVELEVTLEFWRPRIVQVLRHKGNALP